MGGEIEISGGNINKTTGTTASVNNKLGNITITGGTIKSDDGVGVYAESGNVTIGTNETTPNVSTTVPSITGATYGVQVLTGEFNFYDGIIKGKTEQSISKDPTDTPTGYGVYKSTENNVETSILTKEYTATFYYYNGSEIKSKSVTKESATDGKSTITIPTEVIESDGSYGGSYVGLSASTGNMTQAVAPTATTIEISSDKSYYALYRTEVTIYRPSDENTITTQQYYRNQWLTSTSAISNPVLSQSTTGTSNQNPTMVSGYTFKELRTEVSDEGTAYSVADAAKTKITIFYARETKDVTVTAIFWYNSNTTSGSLTATRTTANGVVTNTLHCTSTSEVTIVKTSKTVVTIPTEVTGSIGQYNTPYHGLATTLNSMKVAVAKSETTASITKNTTYYAIYGGGETTGEAEYVTSKVTVYRPRNQTASTTQQFYRNEFFKSTSAMNTVLSTNTTGTINANPTMVSGYEFLELRTGTLATGEAYTVANAAKTDITTFYVRETKDVTATIWYNSNINRGGLTATSKDASATNILSCKNTTSAYLRYGDITIPSQVRLSLGKYNAQYAGLASEVGTMTNAKDAITKPITSSVTTMELAENKTFYAIYSSSVSIYRPSSKTEVGKYTAYRNEYFTSTSAMATKLGNSATATSDITLISGIYGTLEGFNKEVNTNSNTYATIDSLRNSDSTTVYARTKISTSIKFYSGVEKTKTDTVAQTKTYYCKTVSETNVVNGTITTPTPASVSDWTTLGWRDDTTAGAKEQNSGTSITPTVTTYYAVYSRTLTISYNGNNSTSGSVDDTTKTIYLNANSTETSNQQVTLSDNTDGFIRTGYSFSKWAEGSATGTQYEAGASYTLNPAIEYDASTFGKTMYAIWTPNTYKLTYNYNVGTYTYASKEYLDTAYIVNWDEDFKIDAVINIPMAGRRYLIAGSYEKDSTESKDLSIEINWDKQLRIWIDGAERGVSTGTVATGTDLTISFTWTASTQSYTFSATGTDSNASINGTMDITGNSAKSLVQGTKDHRNVENPFGVFTLKSFSISKDYTYGTEIGNKLITPNKYGYTFNGWYNNETYNTQLTSSNYITPDTATFEEINTPGTKANIYAKWTPNTYSVKFNSNGGTGTMADQTFTYGVWDNLTINSFTRTGYTFTGWSTSSSDKNIIFDANEYWYNNTNGTSYATLKEYEIAAPFASGEVYQLDLEAKGTGTLSNFFYGFDGYLQVASWTNSNGESGTASDGNNTIPLSNDYTYYTVRFTLGSTGNGNVNKRLLFRTQVGCNAAIRNIKFYKSSQNSRVYLNGQPVKNLVSSGTVDLYAIWKANNYKVRFNSNGGTGTMADQTFAYGEYKGLSGNTFTKTGYEFVGWSTATNGQNIIYDNSEKWHNNTSGTSYATLIQYEIAAPFSSGDVYQLELDAKGTGTLSNFFYGFDGYLQVASWTNSKGQTGTNTDGNNTIPITSDYSHYSVRFTLGSTGNGNINKLLLFRTQAGCNAAIKNVRFYKVSQSSTAYINGHGVRNLTATDGGIVNLYAIWKPTNYFVSAPYKYTNKLAEAVSVAKAGATITVLKDGITDASSPSASRDVTINLNGKTLTVSNQFAITSGKTTIKGSGRMYKNNTNTSIIRLFYCTSTGSISIEDASVESSGACIWTESGCTGTVNISNSGINSYLRATLQIHDCSSVTITSSSVIQHAVNKHAIYVETATKATSITIGGSSIVANTSNGVGLIDPTAAGSIGDLSNPCSAICIKNGSTLNIQGNTCVIAEDASAINLYVSCKVYFKDSSSAYSLSNYCVECIQSKCTINVNTSGYLYAAGSYTVYGHNDPTMSLTKGHFVSRTNKYMTRNNGTDGNPGGGTAGGRYFNYVSSVNASTGKATLSSKQITGCYYLQKGI